MNGMLSLLLILLLPLVPAGLALIHQGLGRSRSAAHTMLATLCAMALASIVFVMVGSAWAGYAGASHAFYAGGIQWDWLGADPFFADGLHSNDPAGLHAWMVMALEMFLAGMVAVIPISTGSDRWRLGAVCASSIFTAAVVFPLFAHWVFAGGWLKSVGGFDDRGGAGVVQALGGLTALAVAWILGPRTGKYTDGMATAIPGHNIVQVLFGCLLALVGWIGLDGAVATLFYGASELQVMVVVVNAMLGASSGLLAAVLVTRMRYRKPDSTISANGWIAGLVAGSAGCTSMAPLQTIFVGLIAGGLVTWMVEALEMTLLLDDPGGAISVHAGAGLWGLLAYGFLVPPASGGRWAHLLGELVGIATLLGVMLPLVYAGNLLLNRLVEYRVDRDGDWQGMDIRELGSGAYPEFVIHADDFVPR